MIFYLKNVYSFSTMLKKKKPTTNTLGFIIIDFGLPCLQEKKNTSSNTIPYQYLVTMIYHYHCLYTGLSQYTNYNSAYTLPTFHVQQWPIHYVKDVRLLKKFIDPYEPHHFK